MSQLFSGKDNAFHEAFGAKNRLLRYGRDIRCAKQPSLVRDASQRPAEQPTPQTVDSLLPTGRIFRGPRCMKTTSCPPDASSVRETAPALFVRSGPFHHFLRPANAELVSGGPFPCSFEGKDRGNQLISGIATESELLSVIIINPSQPESGKYTRCKKQARPSP